MLHIKYISLIGLCFMTLLSCEQDTIAFDETKKAVVESYLHAGHPIDSVQITQVFAYSQKTSDIVFLDNLDVTITDEDNNYALHSIGEGVYQNLDVIIQEGKSYAIQFEWNGEQISSQTYIPQKTLVEISDTHIELAKIEAGSFGGGFGGEQIAIDVTWDNSDNDYYYLVINNIEDNPEYVNENIAEFEAENGGVSRFNFVSKPELTDFFTINANRQLTQYGTHQIIVLRVNYEYAALYESAGNSTISLETPPSNINNGYGIFTGVSSDTVYLEVAKI